jgi:serine/threonine protein kinase
MIGNHKRDVELFSEAIKLPTEERIAFLDRACAADDDLHRRIERLLRFHDRAGNYMESPPTEWVSEVRAKVSSGEKPGDRIGRYKLLEQIGEGGCGVVFIAEQEEPVSRCVALKVVKPGMDTKSVVARFEAERQALALMDHSNIAHVFDAGATQSGRPYFVMELVEGDKITDYCDRHHLPMSARLALFVQICDAIQHAHQKGIIHRDIKPSNILVTTGPEGKPAPKVIDFGIAKAIGGQLLTEKTIFTAREMLIGTPAYMSPEQAALASTDLDTRTDIYSLGALLYELLTGTTPFDTRELLKAGFDEVRRVIREKEPVRPSTRLSTLIDADGENLSKHQGAEAPKLIREMRGDLDWIVIKALEKDRARRYATANGLAMDINRYLSGEAVLARPPSASYKFRKLVARNKLVFSGVALIFVLLVISLATTIRWLMIERRAKELMQMQLDIPRLESSGFLLMFQFKYTEAEQAYRKALELRRKVYGIDSAAERTCNELLIMFKDQHRLDKIKPLLSEHVTPSLLSGGAFRDVFQSAIETLGENGLWENADALTDILQKAVPDNPEHYKMRAPLLVVRGDVEGYRRLSERIIFVNSHMIPKLTDPGFADWMAKECLILPSTGADLKVVSALADIAVTRGSNSPALPYFQFCKSLAEFRLGRHEEAVNWARRAAGGSFLYPKASAAAVMAMSEFKLNQLEQARTSFSNCNKLIEEQMPKPGQVIGKDWRDWIIARALQSEAKRMIDGAPSSAAPPSSVLQ